MPPPKRHSARLWAQGETRFVPCLDDQTGASVDRVGAVGSEPALLGAQVKERMASRSAMRCGLLEFQVSASCSLHVTWGLISEFFVCNQTCVCSEMLIDTNPPPLRRRATSR